MNLKNRLKYWLESYLHSGVTEDQEPYLKRQIYLSNKYTSFVTIMALLFLVFNLYSGNFNRVFYNVIEVIIVQSVPLINKLKWSKLSRIILCLTPLFATILSRIGETSFDYVQYGILSYVALICSFSPLVFFNYNKEKIIFWTLAILMLMFLMSYNFLLAYLSNESFASVWDQPYMKFKVPELLLWLAMMVGVMIFKSVGEKAEEKERLSNIQLKKANIDITRLVEKVEESNSKLEEKVKERTKTLEERNSQLIDYAFMNSHLLRAPVSKIQGLLNLLNTEIPGEEKNKIIGFLNSSVEELDKVVLEINEKVKES